MSSESQRTLSLRDVEAINLFGQQDLHLRMLEKQFGVRLVVRDGQLTLYGPQAAIISAAHLLDHLIDRVRGGATITVDDVRYAVTVVEDQSQRDPSRPAELREAAVLLRGEKRIVRVRTHGQARYVHALEDNEIAFAIGPAGTGKTYLAVAWALRNLKEKWVDRIVLVRPAVEAGESLGFLPGDLQEKVDPYLRPLYDALREMVSYEKLQRFLQLGVVEVAPLAYMRGRTLARAFVILDEAQNTTLPQMKMFLTRLGPGSRAVITGDITQIDLNCPGDSGLVRIRDILEGIDGISFIELGEQDVVRHRLVRSIITAFEQHDPPERGEGRE